MALKLKMFETLGMVTLVTPPSMMNPEKISFTLVNLKEKEKNHFAIQLNKCFPNDNVVVYIYDTFGQNNWLKQAMSKSNYVIVNKDTVPVWIEEEVPAKAKIFYVSKENTVEQTFENIQKESIE
jgi:hypothetical protein|tara:strand:+ start:194 stop:565 length:372 start_codon:yes stop_codon:yes gene_type:complete